MGIAGVLARTPRADLLCTGSCKENRNNTENDAKVSPGTWSPEPGKCSTTSFHCSRESWDLSGHRNQIFPSLLKRGPMESKLSGGGTEDPASAIVFSQCCAD